MELGNINFEIHTTSHRGHTPEEIAEFALAKIMYVSKDANPLIRDQAEAFKGYIRDVLLLQPHIQLLTRHQAQVIQQEAIL
jgi:hypothetical protein